jgi:type 1 glutamine amidotransferase
MQIWKVCLTLFLMVLMTVAIASASDVVKSKVLLVTGDDVSPAHNWRENAETTREVLEKSGKFMVRISEDPSVLESGSLNQYDLIFMALYNATLPTLSPSAKQNLLEFVKGGKGFALSHLASASFKEWDEYKELVGRYWVMGTSGHGPRGTFKAKVADPKDPIMRGILDFEINDELYAKLQGSKPIHLLATADSDWSHKTEPLAFTLEYERGRVFQETFGHDRAAILAPMVQKLIVQGCEWAATGKVSP